MSNRDVLVVLPGWGGSRDTWTDFYNAYTERIGECIIIDLPCFGSELCPQEVWGVEEYAQFVSGKLEGVGGRVHLLGHSFGGQVAVTVAVSRPELLTSLILVGAAIVRPKRRFKRFIFGLFAKFGRLFINVPVLKNLIVSLRGVLYRLANSPDYMSTSGKKRDIFERVIRQDVRHLLPQITLPTLILWGEMDRYTPYRYGEKIASLIDNSKFVGFETGTHGLHHGDSMIRMIDEIEKFIQR